MCQCLHDLHAMYIACHNVRLSATRLMSMYSDTDIQHKTKDSIKSKTKCKHYNLQKTTLKRNKSQNNCNYTTPIKTETKRTTLKTFNIGTQTNNKTINETRQLYRKIKCMNIHNSPSLDKLAKQQQRKP